jgi:general secretion pathway protein G
MSMSAAVRRGEAQAEGTGSRARALSPSSVGRGGAGGWTLIELVITLTVMAVLTMAVIPIVRTSIRRQREVRLREALREMRGAIDEFHRDTVNMTCGALAAQPNGGGGGGGAPPLWVDPRSRVRIAECSLFGVDNPERYPPSLEMLVDGVDVLPRTTALANQFGGTGGNVTEQNAVPVPKKKVYLREIPVDPMTGNKDWCLLSNYDAADGGCSNSPNNVFDVRSRSEGTALNGKEKYNEW